MTKKGGIRPLNQGIDCWRESIWEKVAKYKFQQQCYNCCYSIYMLNFLDITLIFRVQGGAELSDEIDLQNLQKLIQ